ncbi:hypothetical protein IAU60_000405 [Kwoniella sp. DSM 27419]
MDTSARFKRARSISSDSSYSSDGSAGPSRTPSPPPKYHRAPSPGTKPYSCHLPPTCSQPGTSTLYATQAELDRHQETFHRWVCRIPIRDRLAEGAPKGKERDQTPSDGWVPEQFVGRKERDGKRWRECAKVFPDERILALHQTEVHDPIARQRKENGQKIFECFLPPSQCSRKFIDPKQRRKHLIDKHKFPHQYFFSITNHGLNEIARQDGLATSMIRPRRDITARSLDHKPSAIDTHGSHASPDHRDPGQAEEASPQQDKGPDIDMDDLTSRMGNMESSLTFVPRGLRKAIKAKVGMSVE